MYIKEPVIVFLDVTLIQLHQHIFACRDQASDKFRLHINNTPILSVFAKNRNTAAIAVPTQFCSCVTDT